MRDIYLKFVDEAVAMQALTAIGMAGKPDGTWSVDMIGTIMTPPLLDDNGEIIQDGVVLDGYHVNVRLLNVDETPASLQTYEVTPKSPSRRFA